MSYIVNGARLSSLTIGGVDYTSSLVVWSASDDTAYNNGCIKTTGQVVLGRRTGSTPIEDYGRDLFKRGDEVILEVTYPSGATARHPRGLLYVLTNIYEAESDTITVELGCKLVLADLNDQVDDLVALSPIHLDPTQRRFENVSAAFASVGKYLFQNNQGSLVTGTLFDGDSTSGHAPGEWVSISGVTALNVSPLSGGGPIPDKLQIQYQVPSGLLADDNTGYVETVTTTSDYWVEWPGFNYVRVLNAGDIVGITEYVYQVAQSSTAPTTTRTASRTSSACGNEPPPPSGPGSNPNSPVTIPIPVYASCTDQFQNFKSKEFVPAKRIQTQHTYYDAPGGQVSRIYSEVEGLLVELNSQYYSDKYSFCRQLYASVCDPNGRCPKDGLNMAKMGWTETINYYGEANELVKVVQDTWQNALAILKPSDWRAGVAEGIIKQFGAPIGENTFFRATRQITEYYQENNSNVQLVTTFTSITSRGVGLSAGPSMIDALNGIKTTTKRVSTTTAPLQIAPDRVNTGVTSTDEKTSEIVLFTGRYTQPPTESGPYVQEEQVPMPLLFDTAAEIEAALADYENYIVRLVKGDTFGLSISEVLREDLATNWRPGMPFRYYDSLNDELLGMRMDACGWGVTAEGAVVATDALWTGTSDGTVTIPRNIEGDSRPDLGGGTPTPPAAVIPPSIGGETDVDDGSYAFVVEVHWKGTATAVDPGADGLVSIMPIDTEFVTNEGFVVFSSGLIVAPGSLLSGEGNGGIPIEYQGNLLVETATVIEEDLFAVAP